jgi:hypothetical protein
MAIKNKIKEVASKIGNAKVKDVARTVVAPINPFDTKNKLNIGGNIVKGVVKVGEVIKKKAEVQRNFRNKFDTQDKYEAEYSRRMSGKSNRYS